MKLLIGYDGSSHADAAIADRLHAAPSLEATVLEGALRDLAADESELRLMVSDDGVGIGRASSDGTGIR